jgi:hypothetical protein
MKKDRSTWLSPNTAAEIIPLFKGIDETAATALAKAMHAARGLEFARSNPTVKETLTAINELESAAKSLRSAASILTDTDLNILVVLAQLSSTTNTTSNLQQLCVEREQSSTELLVEVLEKVVEAKKEDTEGLRTIIGRYPDTRFTKQLMILAEAVENHTDWALSASTRSRLTRYCFYYLDTYTQWGNEPAPFRRNSASNQPKRPARLIQKALAELKERRRT